MIVDYAGRQFRVYAMGMTADQFIEEAELRAEYWHPQAGDVILDVGCGAGSWTIVALAAGASVVAVDPYPEYTSQIITLCEDNDVDSSGLKIVNEVLGAEGGYSRALRDGLSESRHPHLHARPHHTFTTMDELVTRLGLERLDKVKIDVEGAELEVLQGGLATLERFHPVMVIEDHTRVYQFAEDLQLRPQMLELLAGLGYTVTLVPYDPGPRGVPRDYLICEL